MDLRRVFGLAVQPCFRLVLTDLEYLLVTEWLPAQVFTEGPG